MSKKNLSYSDLEQMMASGMVRLFISCKDCSKQKECGMRLTPGCCNWTGYRLALLEKVSNK